MSEWAAPGLLRLGLGALGLAGLAALAGAAAGSEALGLTLAPHTPASPAEASGILATNLRVLLLVAAACACWTMGMPRLTLRCCDLALAALLALNAAAIGLALGALGTPALGRVLAHAPAELAGFGVAAAAYLRARRGAKATELTRALALSSALLVLAALLESYLSGEIG